MLNERQVYLRLDRGVQDSKANGLGLFVGNIPWNTTKEELMDLFAQFNPTECILKSRGFGIVVFDSEEDVMKAIEVMHMKDFNGRILEVLLDAMSSFILFYVSIKIDFSSSLFIM